MNPTTSLNYATPFAQPAAFNPWLHWLAVLTALTTFPLIFMGGLVTSHQAGMSVPDWPNSYGYNMFLFPPNLWIGGIFYEHSHRLIGSAVGFFAVSLTLLVWGPARTPDGRRKTGMLAGLLAALTVLVIALKPMSVLFGLHQQAVAKWAPHLAVGFGGLLACVLVAYVARRREPRRWVRWLAALILFSVIVQGSLGGLRVVLVDLDLAIVHACVAQAFFCLTAFGAMATSRWWIEAPDLSRQGGASVGRSIAKLAVLTTIVIYLQLVVGATMRHFRAGLAIPDLPLAYNHWLPPTDQAGLNTINQLRAWKFNLEAVTLGQVWWHFGHRLGAVVVSLFVSLLIGRVWKFRRDVMGLSRLASLLLLLILSQLTLGVLVVYYAKPADITSIHVATGALVLLTTFVIAIRAARLYSRRGKAQGASTQGVGIRAQTASEQRFSA